MDGETFFLYVFLAAVFILFLVIGQQTLISVGRKRTTRSKTAVETGTNNPDNIDWDWLPKQTLAALSKSFVNHCVRFINFCINFQTRKSNKSHRNHQKHQQNLQSPLKHQLQLPNNRVQDKGK